MRNYRALSVLAFAVVLFGLIGSRRCLSADKPLAEAGIISLIDLNIEDDVIVGRRFTARRVADAAD